MSNAFDKEWISDKAACDDSDDAELGLFTTCDCMFAALPLPSINGFISFITVLQRADSGESTSMDNCIKKGSEYTCERIASPTVAIVGPDFEKRRNAKRKLVGGFTYNIDTVDTYYTKRKFTKNIHTKTISRCDTHKLYTF